jgi:YidC/Oxa1 family membrane protein insertase
MLNAYANMKTKSIQSNANMGANSTNSKSDSSSTVNYNNNYKPGSMMAKANMVKEFNEKNNKE